VANILSALCAAGRTAPAGGPGACRKVCMQARGGCVPALRRTGRGAECAKCVAQELAGLTSSVGTSSGVPPGAGWREEELTCSHGMRVQRGRLAKNAPLAGETVCKLRAGLSVIF